MSTGQVKLVRDGTVLQAAGWPARGETSVTWVSLRGELELWDSTNNALVPG